MGRWQWTRAQRLRVAAVGVVCLALWIGWRSWAWREEWSRLQATPADFTAYAEQFIADNRGICPSGDESRCGCILQTIRGAFASDEAFVGALRAAGADDLSRRVDMGALITEGFGTKQAYGAAVIETCGP